MNPLGPDDLVDGPALAARYEDQFQPRWVAWARVNGRLPQEQLDADRNRHGTFNGGPFMAWISRTLRDFLTVADPDDHRSGSLTEQGHDTYTAYLLRLPIQ